MLAWPDDKTLVRALVDIVGQGISHERFDDDEAVIDALRLLRPALPELETFQAWIAFRRGHWLDAIRLLRDIERAAPDFGPAKALLALCQFATGDPVWHASAHDIIDSGRRDEAAGLVQLLIDPGDT